jgi:hypothetical protein
LARRAAGLQVDAIERAAAERARAQQPKRRPPEKEETPTPDGRARLAAGAERPSSFGGK